MRHVLSFFGKNTTSKTLIKSEKKDPIMSGNETQEGTAKGREGAVKYCMNCGVEFDPALKSSAGIKCNNCGAEFSVRELRTPDNE